MPVCRLISLTSSGDLTAMKDYEPLDLSAFCNAGPEVCGPDRVPALGAQTFHGLPFQIGAGEGKPCFLAFGTEPPLASTPVSIPIEQRARRLLFAHVLRNTHLHEGDPP